MPGSFSLAVVSDIHYAGPAERERGAYYLRCIKRPLRRRAVSLYRRLVWQKDPFAHNHLLPLFIDRARSADLVVVNGDYSCDSGFVGLSDTAALESARLCLDQLRAAFGSRLAAVPGDHEFGKKPLGADTGGLRFASYLAATRELGLEPFWHLRVGRYRLMGVTSTLVAWPVFEREALPGELAAWRQLSEQHLATIRREFRDLGADDRVLLFCHDPTALPYLWQIREVQEKLGQVEHTIIGHLHTHLVLFWSRLLAGMPVIRWLGHTPHRLSQALREARYWKPFHVLLCPSLAGIELFNSGGYLTAGLDTAGDAPVRFRRQRLVIPPLRFAAH